MSVTVSRDDVVAYRVHAHHLAARVELDQLAEVAGRCGVQDSPPGSALSALGARVRGLTREHLNHAIADDKSLLLSWCMRGAPFLFPAADAAAFTTGALPPTEQGRLHLIWGVEPALRNLDLGLDEVVAWCCAEIVPVLTGRRLAIAELGAELAMRLARHLTDSQRLQWEAPGPYAPGQPLGEAVVHFCLRILTLRRLVCFAPRAGNKAPFVLLDEWFGGPLPDAAPQVARAELLRRYLRCYGPSTPRNFAAWLGVRPADTAAWWSLVDPELTQVDFGGPAWILTEYLEALRSAPPPHGVRLLPPRDPYTQLRDRDTIVDHQHHATIWRTVGEPGTVLVDGTIVGTWRPRMKGRRLTLTLTSLRPLTADETERTRHEADHIATLRGAAAVELAVTAPT